MTGTEIPLPPPEALPPPPVIPSMPEIPPAPPIEAPPPEPPAALPVEAPPPPPIEAPPPEPPTALPVETPPPPPIEAPPPEPPAALPVEAPPPPPIEAPDPESIPQPETSNPIAKHPRTGLSKESASEVLALPQGKRPSPENYLSTEYQQWHRDQLKDGAVRIQGDVMKWGIGREKDGGTFVTPYAVSTDSIKSDVGTNSVKITMTGLENVDVKIPTGNEVAANAKWEPGGRLPDGTPEAVIDTSRRPVNRLIRNALKPKEQD